MTVPMTVMVDAILALVVVEAIALLLLRRAAILPNLLAGFMLLAALRLALGGAGLPAIALCLLLAGIAHAVDLRRRWNAR